MAPSGECTEIGIKGALASWQIRLFICGRRGLLLGETGSSEAAAIRVSRDANEQRSR
jgi:hypothetical protein